MPVSRSCKPMSVKEVRANRVCTLKMEHLTGLTKYNLYPGYRTQNTERGSVIQSFTAIPNELFHVGSGI